MLENWRPTAEDLADYLTAEWGEDLAVNHDGSTYLIEHSTTEHDDDAPAVRVRCPGLDSADETWWTEDFVERNEDGEYVTIAPQDDVGRVVGDMADVITESCHEGHVVDYLDELAETVAEALREQSAMDAHCRA